MEWNIIYFTLKSLLGDAVSIVNPSDLSPWAGFWENPLCCRWCESASYFPHCCTLEKPLILKHTHFSFPRICACCWACPVCTHWAPELLLPCGCSCSNWVALSQRRSVAYRQGSRFSELHTMQSPACYRSRACSDLLVLRHCFRIIHVQVALNSLPVKLQGSGDFYRAPSWQWESAALHSNQPLN